MVKIKRFWKNFTYQPFKSKAKIAELKSAIESAIKKSESQHACEIVFVIEDSFSLAWIFTSLNYRINYIFKKTKLNKLKSNKGILIYVSKLDEELGIRYGNGVKIPKENWEVMLNQGLDAIKTQGIHAGCLEIIDMVTSQLIAYEPNSEKGKNEIADELIIK